MFLACSLILRLLVSASLYQFGQSSEKAVVCKLLKELKRIRFVLVFLIVLLLLLLFLLLVLLILVSSCSWLYDQFSVSIKLFVLLKWSPRIRWFFIYFRCPRVRGSTGPRVRRSAGPRVRGFSGRSYQNWHLVLFCYLLGSFDSDPCPEQ